MLGRATVNPAPVASSNVLVLAVLLLKSIWLRFGPFDVAAVHELLI